MGSSGVKKDAFAIQGQNGAQNLSAYNTVNPVYSAFAQGNQGMTQSQVANANTSLQQSQGGTQAGAVGEGNLQAARTGNIGGYSAAVDDAARSGGVTSSQGSLNVQNENAQMAHQNQLTGLQGEQQLFNTTDQAQLGALNAANNVQSPFWQKLLMQGVQSAGQVAAAGG